MKKNKIQKRKYRKLLHIFLLSLTLSLCQSVEVEAQCPMCRMSAQKNLDGGGTAGAGLNAGILYMLMLPYVMVAGIGYVWYRNRKKEEELDFDVRNN